MFGNHNNKILRENIKEISSLKYYPVQDTTASVSQWLNPGHFDLGHKINDGCNEQP